MVFIDEDADPVDGTDVPAGDSSPESQPGGKAVDEITRLKQKNTALATENATLKSRKEDSGKPKEKPKPEPDAVDVTEKLVDIKLHIRDKYTLNPGLKKFDRLIIAGAKDLIASGEETDPIKAIDTVIATLEPESKPNPPAEELGKDEIPAGARGGTAPAPKPKAPPPEEPEPTNDDFTTMRENRRLGKKIPPQT